jgi:2,3-bisphosphoglycerate-dependent phosphoglycerate mutase
MGELILLRHGQSEWNKKDIFTGWIDIPLSKEGIEEALAAGREIQEMPIDIIFTSTLIRASMTVMLAFSLHKGGKVPVLMHPGEGKLEEWSKCYSRETEKSLIPVYAAWELNERMYGALQGMNKQMMRDKFGDEQVHIWRRSYDVAPPEGESLKMTAARTLPYFKKTILPVLESGKNVAIVAHGNSLRSIVMDMEKLSPEEVLKLEIPTGKPLYYRYEKGNFTKSR